MYVSVLFPQVDQFDEKCMYMKTVQWYLCNDYQLVASTLLA